MQNRLIVIRSQDETVAKVIVAEGPFSVEVFEVYDWVSDCQPMYAEEHAKLAVRAEA